MSTQVRGELIPIGGGDSIPLMLEHMTVGRRESCDICLDFSNISGRHCELIFREGYWYIRDLNSTNGTKVNGARVQEKLLHPSDELTIGKRDYTIEYQLPANHRALEEMEEDVMGQSLLERTGLQKPKRRRSGEEEMDPGDYLLGDE